MIKAPKLTLNHSHGNAFYKSYFSYMAILVIFITGGLDVAI